jgi:hypothetical protein
MPNLRVQTKKASHGLGGTAFGLKHRLVDTLGHPHQDDAALLPSVKSQSPAGLPKGDNSSYGATCPVKKDLTKKKK